MSLFKSISFYMIMSALVANTTLAQNQDKLYSQKDERSYIIITSTMNTRTYSIGLGYSKGTIGYVLSYWTTFNSGNGAGTSVAGDEVMPWWNNTQVSEKVHAISFAVPIFIGSYVMVSPHVDYINVERIQNMKSTATGWDWNTPLKAAPKMEFGGEVGLFIPQSTVALVAGYSEYRGMSFGLFCKL